MKNQSSHTTKKYSHAFSEKLEKRLFQNALNDDPFRRRPTLIHAFAWVLATLVYCVLGILIYFGGQMFVDWRTIPIGAGLFAIVAWSLNPRFMEFPPDEVMVDEETFPALNRLVADIAAKLQVEMPKVMLTEDFTAVFGRIGNRRRPLLVLGHPLLSILDERELATIIAHELGHCRDGGWTRLLYIQQARSILVRLLRAARGNGPIDYIVWPLTWIPSLILRGLKWACALDSQRCEYRADAIAHALVSKVDTGDLELKFVYGFNSEVYDMYSSSKPEHKYTTIRRAVELADHVEVRKVWESFHRSERSHFEHHPPQSLRQAHVAQLPDREPLIDLANYDFAEIRLELMRWPVVIHERKQTVLAEIDEEERNQLANSHRVKPVSEGSAEQSAANVLVTNNSATREAHDPMFG